MIILDQISKSFKKDQILRDISCEIPIGKISCIIGENGSGKSTLLSIMAGILHPDHGGAFYGPKRLPPEKSNLSLLPQQDFLFDSLTVKDNISFWAASCKLSIKSSQVFYYLKLFEIQNFLSKKISMLSGGMRRRVALCAALLGNPDIIMLDEPFSGLDILHKTELCNYLIQLQDQGKTIIYTAHNIDEIYILAQNLFVLCDKQLIQQPVASSLDQLNITVTQYLKGVPNHE